MTKIITTTTTDSWGDDDGIELNGIFGMIFTALVLILFVVVIIRLITAPPVQYVNGVAVAPVYSSWYSPFVPVFPVFGFGGYGGYGGGGGGSRTSTTTTVVSTPTQTKAPTRTSSSRRR